MRGLSGKVLLQKCDSFLLSEYRKLTLITKASTDVTGNRSEGCLAQRNFVGVISSFVKVGNDVETDIGTIEVKETIVNSSISSARRLKGYSLLFVI